jgi:hypothetical protein
MIQSPRSRLEAKPGNNRKFVKFMRIIFTAVKLVHSRVRCIPREQDTDPEATLRENNGSLPFKIFGTMVALPD